jgi:hypothetical protein
VIRDNLVFERIRQSCVRRAQACVQNGGGHIEHLLKTLNDNAIQLSNKVIISICVHYFDNEAFVTESSYKHLFLHSIQEHAHKVSKHTYDSPV